MFPKFARRPTGSARDRRHDAERLAALTVSAALVVLLAACSSNEGGHATT